MLSSGDVVDLDLGLPDGHEAGFRHPAVIVTAQAVLDHEPTVIQVVPITSTRRQYDAEVDLEPDDHNGLTTPSVAQCQHTRAVSKRRILEVRGNVGAVVLAQLRDRLAVLLDLP